LTVARHFPQHEFLFLSHGTAADLLKQEYQVVDCPNPETPVRGHKVAGAATVFSNIKVRSQSPRIMRLVLELLDRFQPEAAITDYEYFLPRAARQVGLPCLSLDHQHVITCCRHPVPWPQLPSYLATAWAVRRYFSAASDYLVTSFFQPPLNPGSKVRLLPSLLRASVVARQPQSGDHVVAYQGYATFKRFFPFLTAIKRPVLVYGFNQDRTAGNLRFKKNSEEGFLNDLASCSYVICGGGHSLISEALYLAKPVISFPVKNAFEQFLNAFYVDRLGYGRFFSGLRPSPEIIPAFEARLDHFRQHLRQGRFLGNPQIFALVDHFIRHKALD
jgi:uncharacterized protein (TIGR00661 family)